MALFGDILGLGEIRERLRGIEERLERIEIVIGPEIESLERGEEKVLNALDKARTTDEVASEVGKSRSWASRVLNLLEKKGKVKESGRRGRELLYEKA